MSCFRSFLLPLILAAAALLSACNEATSPAEEKTGGGDFEVASGVRYADTAYTPGIADYQALGDTAYHVTGRLLRYPAGDSSVGTLGFLQLTVGGTPASGTYAVAPYSNGNPTAGKVQLYTWGTPGGMSWTGAASAGDVKIVVTADSVQATGKNITLDNGKSVSFNLKVAKPKP